MDWTTTSAAAGAASSAPGAMAALNTDAMPSMWRLGTQDAFARLQFNLQQSVFNRFKSGHALFDFLIAATVFDPRESLRSSQSALSYLWALVMKILKIFRRLLARIGAFVFAAPAPGTLRLMRVEYITPNFRKNTLFPAVQWYLESAVDIRKESGMMLYYEQEIPGALDPSPLELQRAFPTQKTNKVVFQGFDIHFSFDKEMKTVYGAQPIKKENLVIKLDAEVPESHTRDVLEDFVQMCRIEYQKHLASKAWTPELFRLKREGAGHSSKITWDASTWKNYRKLSTIALCKGQAEELTEIIRDFTTSEPWHLEHGLPWKLALMLYGPPGTGKSVTINALCCETKRNKHMLSLSDLRSDAELFELKKTIDLNKTIIVIEDIDANLSILVDQKLKAMRQDGPKSEDAEYEVHDDELDEALCEKAADNVKVKLKTEAGDQHVHSRGFTIAGLLAFLDGHDAHGMIVIVTTNHPELLDDRIKRCGRLDHCILFDRCTMYQLLTMIEAFYEGAIKLSPEEIRALGIDPSAFVGADVEHVFRQHRRDPKAGVMALASYDPTQRLNLKAFQGQIQDAIRLKAEAVAKGASSDSALTPGKAPVL